MVASAGVMRHLADGTGSKLVFGLWADELFAFDHDKTRLTIKGTNNDMKSSALEMNLP